MAVLGMLRCSLDIFATQNASVDLKPRWHFYASRRAYRPTAVFPIQLTRKPYQTGEPRGPLPSGGKTQTKSLFLYVSAR